MHYANIFSGATFCVVSCFITMDYGGFSARIVMHVMQVRAYSLDCLPFGRRCCFAFCPMGRSDYDAHGCTFALGVQPNHSIAARTASSTTGRTSASEPLTNAPAAALWPPPP